MPRNLYFPSGTLESSSEHEKLVVSWYAIFLEAMDEQPLWPVDPTSPTTYRLLQLPTFSHPSVVRISEGSSGWEIVGKINDGEGGYFPGKRVWDLKRALNVTESEKLEQILQRLQFWSMPVRVDRFGMDGTTWLLEGVQIGRYHVIHRWSPEKGPLVDFGEYLLTASGASGYRPDPQVQERRKAAYAQAEAVANQKRLEAVNRANVISSRLAAELADKGLTCPHCQKYSREIRFFDKSPESKSYFICGLCGRSFSSEELE